MNLKVLMLHFLRAYDSTKVPLDESQGFYQWSLGSSSYRMSESATTPNFVWPELLLILDYGTYLDHDHNGRYARRYFVNFWNEFLWLSIRYAISGPSEAHLTGCQRERQLQIPSGPSCYFSSTMALILATTVTAVSFWNELVNRK